MNKDLELCLDILRPLTYVVSEEEDKVIEDIYNHCNKNSEINIYRATTGFITYNDYIKEAEKKESKSSELGIESALNTVWRSATTDRRSIFVFLDIDHYLNEAQIVRKFKDIILQISHDKVCIKTVVIISADLVVPRKLTRYMEAVYYDLPAEIDIRNKIKGVLDDFNATIDDKGEQVPSPLIHDGKENGAEFVRAFKGLTLFETERIVLSSAKRFKEIKIEEVSDYKKSILRKTTLLEMMPANVSLGEVGGMDRLKSWLDKRKGAWTKEGIEANIPLLKGLMLIGITGCGKSYISKGIANAWNLPLIKLDTSKLFSSRVGESEGNMLKALKIVESIAPCVLFIDEIEKTFAGSQSSSFSDSGVTSRVIGSYLTWSQESTAPVFTVATCNSIQYLPPELISRFDDKFFVNIPSRSERIQIYEIQLARYYKEWKKSNINSLDLAKKSETLTGREIEQVIKASMYELFADMKAKNNYKLPLKQEHIERVLQNKVPVMKTMEDDIKYLIQWVGWDESRKDGIRANYANIRETDIQIDDDINNLLNEVLSSKENYVDKFKNKNKGNDFKKD